LAKLLIQVFYTGSPPRVNLHCPVF